VLSTCSHPRSDEHTHEACGEHMGGIDGGHTCHALMINPIARCRCPDDVSNPRTAPRDHKKTGKSAKGK
jgi:hypothetical protein